MPSGSWKSLLVSKSEIVLCLYNIVCIGEVCKEKYTHKHNWWIEFHISSAPACVSTVAIGALRHSVWFLPFLLSMPYTVRGHSWCRWFRNKDLKIEILRFDKWRIRNVNKNKKLLVYPEHIRLLHCYKACYKLKIDIFVTMGCNGHPVGCLLQCPCCALATPHRHLQPPTTVSECTTRPVNKKTFKESGFFKKLLL